MRLHSLFTVLSACSLFGCAHTSSTRVSSPDTITIRTVFPERGTVLSKGQSVGLKISIDYVLSSASEGEVVLAVFVPDTGRNLVEAQPALAVSKGSGQATLSADFTVPGDTDRVGLSVILAGEPRNARTVESKPAAQRIEFYPVR